MNDQDFSQENDFWKQLKLETEPFEQQRKLVIMAHLLLNRANTISHNFSHIDSDDLTTLIIQHQKVSQQSEIFFEKALPHIDPAFKGQSFEQQLQTLQQELSNTADAIVRYQQQNAALAEHQIRLKGEITTLNEIKPQLEIHEENVRQLQAQLDQLIHYKNCLEQSEKNSEQLQKDSIKTVIESVPVIVSLIKANQEIYQIYFDENNHIGEAMQQLETSYEMAAHTEKIAELSNSIDTFLQDFDNELRTLIELQEQVG
ncbi:MAG: hypothetical protein GY795_28950 [Desulfobacterales bacterium]|nr:hypothetical protein [Desulfobacterales bacterium]